MSFENNYKKEMDNIRTDGFIRQKVLAKMETEQNKKHRFPVARVAVAIACLCLAVGVALPAVPNISKNNAVASSNKDASGETEKSYDTIYRKVKELKIQARDIELYAIEDSIAYATADGASATGGTNKSSANDVSATNKDDYSETTAQVEGVDEADIVKTDGKYIYSLSARNKKIRVIKAGKTPEQVATIPAENVNYYSQNMYLYKDRLVVFGTEYDSNGVTTQAIIYDVSDPANPQKLTVCVQDGDYNDSRLIGDKLYMISNYGINVADINPNIPETYVPSVECKDFDGACPADSIYISKICNFPQYTVICGFDITDGSLKGTQSVLGGTYAVYCSTENIITAGYSEAYETEISRYAINDGEIELKSTGSIKGTLLNQFSMDEYKDFFRFVVTTDKWVENEGTGKSAYQFETSNALYVLDKDLKQVGAIENLAPDERVYSVRFMGDIAYFVTFRQVDPLFSADLSDPESPKIIGSLKIPGFSSYLYPYGKGQLFGIGQDADENTARVGNVKLSMFDISDPSDVKETAKSIIDLTYTTALHSHKATLIDYKRNLIGFWGYTNDNRKYEVFSFTDGEFVKKAEIVIASRNENVRGLYIGNELYIVTDDSLYVYSLENFELVYELTY